MKLTIAQSECLEGAARPLGLRTNPYGRWETANPASGSPQVLRKFSTLTVRKLVSLGLVQFSDANECRAVATESGRALLGVGSVAEEKQP